MLLPCHECFMIKQFRQTAIPNLHFSCCIMRILFLGDIVGKPGYSAVLKHAEPIRAKEKLDALVVNAENASDGSGLMPRQYKRLLEAGVDAITLGDHIYRCKEIIPVLETSKRMVKPANYPGDATGRTWTIVETPAGPLGIISLLGRVYMRPVDCPFDAVDLALDEIGDAAKHILVDIHAEATSDKQVLARYLDGKVTAVLGTHTHVPTADAHVMELGTAFQCDVGMSGPYDSIIGRDVRRVMQTTRSFEPCHFHVATRDVRLCGAVVESGSDGKATSIRRFEMAIKD
jgi:metallophosphoesterase (TIGR00282 family)